MAPVTIYQKRMGKIKQSKIKRCICKEYQDWFGFPYKEGFKSD